MLTIMQGTALLRMTALEMVRLEMTPAAITPVTSPRAPPFVTSAQCTPTSWLISRAPALAAAWVW
jgi:hypothetical protein